MDKITFEFRKYNSATDRCIWDDFVTKSRNATFLHLRGYMDYHSDRFDDASLIALRNGKPIAMLPACRQPDGTLSSHAGLTYGSWLLPPAHLDGAAILRLIEQWVEYCSGRFSAIDYKPVPYIYHAMPSQEDMYALWRCGFTARSVNLSSTIDLSYGCRFNMSKRQQLRKAEANDITIKRETDFSAFWQILETCLQERHDTTPVHSLDEISRLALAFPDNIKLYVLSDREGPQAGVCIYDTGRVAHSQYGATTARAREKFYLTALYHHLITEVFAHCKYFDFGISNERGGKVLNYGLLNQKYSMGATGVTYTTYHLKL